MRLLRLFSCLILGITSFSIQNLFADPITFQRTVSTPNKVSVSVPVEFSRKECVDWVDTPHTVMRAQFVPCGFFGYLRMCFIGYYPVTMYTRDCVKHDIKTTTEAREVVLKFKKGTDVPVNEEEEYRISAIQKQFNSDRISVQVDLVRTYQPYKIQIKGRRAIIRTLK